MVDNQSLKQEDDRRQWAYRWAGKDEADILRRDQKRSMRQANNSPACLAIKSAQGALLEDFCGRQYVDLHGNNCHHIGHNHPVLIAALQEQISRLSFNSRGFTNLAYVQLAERLGDLWAGDDPRLLLVPGGSAAVELALAVARVHTGRYRTLSFADSFHGRSLGAVGLTALKSEKPERLGPLLPGAIYVKSFRASGSGRGGGGARKPDEEAAARISLDEIRKVLRSPGDIACFIAEPIANGGYCPPDWYWPEVRQVCDRHECLLIFDEIPLGLGKTGSFFVNDRFGMVPDMTVLGKALGGAVMPAAAVMVAGRLDTSPELNLGYFTHEKNPLMARAALETINIIHDENLVERAANLGPEIQRRLDLLRRKHHALILSCQGEGMIHGLNLDTEARARGVFQKAIQQGVILNYPGNGSSVKLSFPLNIELNLVDQIFATLGKVFSEASRGA